LALLPARAGLLAPALVLGELAKQPTSLPFEGTNTTPGDDERLARVGRHGSEVDLPQVNGSLDAAGSLARLRYLEAGVQFKAPIPDQHARPSVLWQGEWQHQGRVAFAHRQHDAPFLPMDGPS